MSSLKIETPRLILRPFTLEDIAPAYAMNLDPDVSQYTGDGGIVSEEENQGERITEDVLRDYEKHGFGRFAVELKGEDSFIGFAGLKYLEDLKQVDLGYRFMKKYWGQGIATEAGEACVQYGFEELNLKEMIGFVLSENVGSVRVLEKLGFKYVEEMMEEDLLVHQYVLKR